MARGMHYTKLKVICFAHQQKKEVSLEIAYFNHLSLINRKRVLVHTPAPVMTAPEGSYEVLVVQIHGGKDLA